MVFIRGYCQRTLQSTSMGFEEGKFLEAAQEIDNIKLDGFEFFTESLKESVQCKIYRKYEEVSRTNIHLFYLTVSVDNKNLL